MGVIYMLTKYEQETQIYWNEESLDAEIYTASPVTYRKIMKLCVSNPEEYQLIKTDYMGGEEVSWTFHLSSKKLLRFGKKKHMSDEDKQILASRLLMSQKMQKQALKKKETGGLINDNQDIK